MIEEFYKNYYHIVYGFLLSLCADPSMAEELTAETFFKAIEKIHTYDPKYKPSTWLCTIGKNLYYNECRRKKRHLPLDEASYIAAPSPEVLHMKKDEAQQILKLLEQFSEENRQLFLMRLEGMSFRDIGLALGMSETLARVTYFRIKSKIRSEMEGEK
ncbi:MAG: RNA polymerase sigma factor [Oscillospiraceae bacterium]|nr:RNA polymerase sigma factor [Oscillospiraceae bacterium]